MRSELIKHVSSPAAAHAGEDFIQQVLITSIDWGQGLPLPPIAALGLDHVGPRATWQGNSSSLSRLLHQRKGYPQLTKAQPIANSGVGCPCRCSVR